MTQVNKETEQQIIEDYCKQKESEVNELIEYGKELGNLFRVKGNKIVPTIMKTPYDYYKDEVRKKKISLNEEEEQREARAISPSNLVSSQKKSQEEEEREKERKKILSAVDKIFDHFEANPSDEKMTEIVLKTYVTDRFKPLPPELDFKQIANRGGVNEKFLESIIDTFEKIKDKDSVKHADERIKFIIGVKGAGKTSFFNYFISRYEQFLNDKKIISVRINVMKIKEGSTTLEEAIRFKICRILFSYYSDCFTKKEKRFEGKRRRDLIDNILLYLNKKFTEEPTVCDCHDYFCKYNSKELIKIEIKYKKICDMLIEEVKKEYKFLIILDNFDQLSIKTTSKKMFNDRYNDLNTLKSNEEKCLGVFLVALRYQTYVTIKSVSKIDPDRWTVATPSTYDMIKKRLDYYNNSDDKKAISENFEASIRIIGSSFNINKNQTVLDLIQACENIDKLFGYNNRSIINIIRHYIESSYRTNLAETLDTLDRRTLTDSILTHYNYRFFETLLVDKNLGFCRKFYKYAIESKSNKLIVSELNDGSNMEFRYFTNIVINNI